MELSWKTLRDYLILQGFSSLDSPKKVIRMGFAEGYIVDGEGWMVALNDRNLTVHTHKKELAEQIVADIANKYFGLIKGLFQRLSVERERG